jgi:hypothetical protein
MLSFHFVSPPFFLPDQYLAQIAAQLALAGDGSHTVSLDEAISAMKVTARGTPIIIVNFPMLLDLDTSSSIFHLKDMLSHYKETSRSGLAVRELLSGVCSSPFSLQWGRLTPLSQTSVGRGPKISSAVPDC